MYPSRFSQISIRYTYNIDPVSVESKITGRTRAIMAVDLHGLPADYPALIKIARKHNLLLIDDGSHAAVPSSSGKEWAAWQT